MKFEKNEMKSKKLKKGSQSSNSTTISISIISTQSQSQSKLQFQSNSKSTSHSKSKSQHQQPPPPHRATTSQSSSNDDFHSPPKSNPPSSSPTTIIKQGNSKHPSFTLKLARKVNSNDIGTKSLTTKELNEQVEGPFGSRKWLLSEEVVSITVRKGTNIGNKFELCFAVDKTKKFESNPNEAFDQPQGGCRKVLLLLLLLLLFLIFNLIF